VCLVEHFVKTVIPILSRPYLGKVLEHGAVFFIIFFKFVKLEEGPASTFYTV